MQTPKLPPYQAQGFTMVELMIVLAIVAILSMIAIPTYNYARYKAWRAEGRSAIMETLLQQERVMTQKGTYVAFDTSTPNGFTAYSKGSASDSAYSLRATACGTSLRECVLITATAIKSDPDVTSMSKNSWGDITCRKGASNVDMSICWP